MQQIKNIIFDLGGVIINLDIPATANAFQQLAKKYGNNDYSPNVEHPVFSEFEVGAITEQDFRNTLKTYINPMVSDNEIDTAWNAMLLDIPAERLELLLLLKNKYNTYLFSNTNAIHYTAFNQILLNAHGYSTLDTFFHKAYYSHIAKVRKPNVEAFQLILDENNLLAQETLFLDDTQMHLDGAAKLGIQTQQVSNKNTIHDILKFF
jgi:FMN phosphatase YigB (HAD superfamily)